jgi:hypothetical protein
MNELINPGDIVKHVYPGFNEIDLFVVKKITGGKYKCRFLINEIFGYDEFEESELLSKEQFKAVQDAKRAKNAAAIKAIKR